MKCQRGPPTGGLQILCTKEHHDLYSLPNIVWVIRMMMMMMMMMQAGRMAVMVKYKMCTGF